NIAAGSAFSITVTALDPFNNTASAYRGTVKFTSTDSAASLPVNYTFTTADAGSHVFSGLKLQTLGSQTIAVTDTTNASIAGSTIIVVNAAGLHYGLNAPAT